MKNKWKKIAVGLFAVALILGIVPASESKREIFVTTVNAAPPGGSGFDLTGHTITLYANNGTDEKWSKSGSSGNLIIESPDSYNFTTPSNKLFSHWNTAADGTGTDYPVSSVYIYNMDVTLYAQWFVPVEKVTLNEETVTLTEGADKTLTATVTPADAAGKEITWESGDTSVAVVDENGKVSAVKAGTTTITAKVKYGTTYIEYDKTATCTVTVTAKKVAETYTKLSDKNNEEYGWCVDKENGCVYLVYKLKASEDDLKDYDFISILNAQNETMVPGDELSEGDDGYEGKFNTVYTAIQFPDQSTITAGENEYLIAFELSGLTTKPGNFRITTGVNE